MKWKNKINKTKYNTYNIKVYEHITNKQNKINLPNNLYNNIIKINIFHNNNTCYEDRHFPIHLRKPLQMASKSLCLMKINSVLWENQTIESIIYSIKQNEKFTCIIVVVYNQ